MKLLRDRLLESFSKHQKNLALEIGDHQLSYSQLLSRAQDQWQSISENCQGSLVGILGGKSAQTYSSILSVMFAGKGYLPLHPDFPLGRTQSMIELAELNCILVSPEAKEAAAQLHPQLPNVKFIETSGGASNTEPKSIPPCKRNKDSLCYLLFTSGSTGMPKGIPVRESNLNSYLSTVLKKFPLHESDRVSQTFDFTFDLSVHDIFTTWLSGACLCPLKNEDLFFPANFIKEKNLSVWFSVPSLAMNMKRMKQLTNENLSSLRLSLFCGEALPSATAISWKEASNSETYNLYGPTEATIAITDFNCSDLTNPEGTVPIGQAFDGQQAKIIDENQNFIESDGQGELVLNGSQVVLGYLKNPEKTEAAFVKINNETWYRTGDLVERKDNLLHYKNRLDFQVKINGFRIELEEIESAARLVLNNDLCVAIALPAQNPEFIDLAVQGEEDNKELLSKINEALPYYMQVREINFITELPRNSNGKIDRVALANLLQS